MPIRKSAILTVIDTQSFSDLGVINDSVPFITIGDATSVIHLVTVPVVRTLGNAFIGDVLSKESRTDGAFDHTKWSPCGYVTVKSCRVWISCYANNIIALGYAALRDIIGPLDYTCIGITLGNTGPGSIVPIKLIGLIRAG